MEDLSLGIRHPGNLPAELDRVLGELLALLQCQNKRLLPVFTGSFDFWDRDCVTVPAGIIRRPEHPTQSGMHAPEGTEHQQKSCFHRVVLNDGMAGMNRSYRSQWAEVIVDSTVSGWIRSATNRREQKLP
ncbi:hypothetical protein [Microvirga yunnanensis]|nr:hypothetical protein [Microvirga sp. HBU67655]